MSLILSLLLSLCSVGILAGRIYEILKLTNIETGFLITEGIALNPVLLGLFVLITICCGILIFGREKDPAPFFSEKSAQVGNCFVVEHGCRAAYVPLYAGIQSLPDTGSGCHCEPVG